MLDLLGEAIDLEGLQPEERERKILMTYRASCKACMPSQPAYPPRSAHARVMDPEKDRPKYHLVYFTSHPRGIVEFMDISDDVAFRQRQVRAEVKQVKRERVSRTRELFDAGAQVEEKDGHVKPGLVDEFWRTYLRQAGGRRRVGLDEFADILEKTDWFPADLQQSLVRLIGLREVRNLDAQKPRPKKPLHFDADFNMGETLQLENHK
jgi:hypothetical protein